MEGLLAHCDSHKLARNDLALIPAPEGTETFKPVPHVELVSSVLEGLSFRQINVVRDEYAVSENGMKLFGVLDLYFNPQFPEFQPRTLWSLSNAFTSAFKGLDPVPQFKATAKLGEFLSHVN